ncbi:MAG: energy transducer TonB [Flavobacteriales bacterium]
MLRNMLSSFIVLFILLEAKAQTFQFLAPPSVKAELTTNEWVVKSIPSNNYIFQYRDYQLQHVATGAIVHIVQRPDTVEWNPQITTWQEWLYKGAKKTTFLSKEETKLNDFTLFQFSINDSMLNIGALRITNENVNILVHCFLSPKKKIQQKQIQAFRSLINSLEIWSTSDFDKHFGYPLKSNMLYCGKLEEKLKQRALDAQSLDENIEGLIVWNHSVKPSRIEVDATKTMINLKYSCGELDKLLLPEKRNGFTYEYALKDFKTNYFRHHDLIEGYDYFLGIKEIGGFGVGAAYKVASSEFAKKTENEKRKSASKFIPRLSLTFPNNNQPDELSKWVIFIHDTIASVAAYENMDGEWRMTNEFNFPNSCSILQESRKYNNWKYGEYLRCFFSGSENKRWVVAENRKSRILEDTTIIELPDISVFSRNHPLVPPIELQRGTNARSVKQSFLADIYLTNPSDNLIINSDLSLFTLNLPNDLVSPEMADLRLNPRNISYCLLDIPRTLRSDLPAILPPDQRIYHLPSFATDLNKNRYTEVWIASISNGTIVHLDIVEETDHGFIRIPSSDQWMSLISSLTEVQIILKDSKRTENHFQSAEELGGSNFPIAIEESAASEGEEYRPQEPPVMPEFPGGEPAMYQFIRKNLVYPKALKKAGVKGTVFVKAIVNNNGKISDVAIWEKRGVSPELGKEAIRLVSSFPNWITYGKSDQIIVPITFE